MHYGIWDCALWDLWIRSITWLQCWSWGLVTHPKIFWNMVWYNLSLQFYHYLIGTIIHIVMVYHGETGFKWTGIKMEDIWANKIRGLWSCKACWDHHHIIFYLFIIAIHIKQDTDIGHLLKTASYLIIWWSGIFNALMVNSLGAVSIRKTVLPGMAIPMLKIRRPNGRLIFNMEIAIRR